MSRAKMRYLSPSLLNLSVECPRCFWLHVNKGFKRPEGPSSTLPRGMDLAIKAHFDKYRPNLPPGLEDRVKGNLFGDWETLRRWRYWKTGPKYTDEKLGVILTGALDDTLVDKEGKLSPLDYKTYGFQLKEAIHPTYQLQMDCYTLMLSSSGHKVNGKAYLVYYSLQNLRDNGLVSFLITPRVITTDQENARVVLKDAIKTLRGDVPSSRESCAFCNWNIAGYVGGEESGKRDF